MKKIKCIIVDDEPLAIDGIEIYIKQIEYLELVGTFNDALQLGKFLEVNSVDLLFLDIEMPHLTGINFLKSIENKPATILTTAYPEYALDAFNLNVIDYLLKPFRFERFHSAVEKAKEFHIYNQSKETKDHIFIRSERQFIKVLFNDIEYISGLKDYVIIYTLTKKIITSMNIKTIYSQLPKELFLRSSKSHIINISFIKSINGDSVQLQSKIIPIGKAYKTEFYKRVFNSPSKTS